MRLLTSCLLVVALGVAGTQSLASGTLLPPPPPPKKGEAKCKAIKDPAKQKACLDKLKKTAEGGE